MNILLLIIGCLILSAFFSGLEIALIASNKLLLEIDKKQKNLPSILISIYSKNKPIYVTTMLLGNNLALVIYGILMAKLLEPILAYYIQSELSIRLIQTIISTLIILIMAEFLPKNLVQINPNVILKIFSIPVFFFFILFYPISFLFNKLINLFIAGKKEEERVIFSKIDLFYLLENQESKQENDELLIKQKDNLQLFQNVLEFSKIRVRDCMIPRAEIVAVEVNTSLEELKKRFIETGLSKIVIYENEFDNIIGYITLKSLFKKPFSIKQHIIQVTFVPETMYANKLLHQLIQEHKSLAIVIDEYGGVSGLVTIEDILEEIFGEIVDEHDSINLIEKKLNDKEYIFSGRLEIEYINEKYNLNLPESEDYDTLAGFIFHHYANIPSVNQIINIGKYQFQILKASSKKIELVKLTIL